MPRPRTRLQPLLPLLLLACLLVAVGCGDPLEERREARRAEAEALLAQAPEPIQERVRQTCERWRDTFDECDSDRVYEDALTCWLEKGAPFLRASLEKGMRKRATRRRVLLHHSLCMEAHGWRLRPGTGGHF